MAWGPMGAGMGIVEVSLDGVEPQEIDLYSNSAWEPLVEDLPDTEHTVAIRLTGRKNDESGGTAAQFDLFEAFSVQYPSEGFALSEPIVCPPDGSFRWRRLRVRPRPLRPPRAWPDAG